MQLPPLEVIAKWPVANYKDPVTRGPANLVINILFFFLALSVVLLRLYARLKISKSFGWDDGLIVAAMFPATAFAILGMLTATHYQWDRHIWDVKLQLIQIGLQLSIVSEILFALATNLTKLSILSLIYRIASQGLSAWTKLMIAAMVLIIAQLLAFILVVLFQCGAPSAYWTLQFLPQPQCISETKNLLAAGIVNTVTDCSYALSLMYYLIIWSFGCDVVPQERNIFKRNCQIIVVVLPIPMVFKLQLPTRQQIAIAILFGVGFLVTLAGAARTVYLYRTTTSWDKTWLAYPVYIASAVELYVGIICASIPATKTFIAYYIPKFLSSELMSDSQRSRSTEVTAVTMTDPSKMSSIVIGNYDGMIPLHEYENGQHPGFADRHDKDTTQMRHTIAVFPPNPMKNRAYSPECGVETMYEMSKVESHEDLIIQRSPPSSTKPLFLNRPPPSYRQSR